MFLLLSCCTHLHFTLIILKPKQNVAMGGLVVDLHFTLIILKLYNVFYLIDKINEFTFHFDYIKTFQQSI